MSEYLARPDAVLPDLIVSADLEVFEDRAIFSKMEPELYPAADWVSLRESPCSGRRAAGRQTPARGGHPSGLLYRELGICEQMRLPDWDGLASAGSTTLPSRR